MKRTSNGILIPDVPIIAGGNLPNAVKGVSAGGADWKKHAVDMGLPSGTLWADCDIDVNMPDGFCVTPFIYQKSFFSWGNVQGYNPIANSFNGIYNWDSSSYDATVGKNLSVDIPTDKSHDAAFANLGSKWKMPTTENFNELIANCIYIDANGVEIEGANKSTIINGIRGVYLQSRINENKLFFSFSGWGYGVAWQNLESTLSLWLKNYNSNSEALCIVAERQFTIVKHQRFVGSPIRPIIND